MNKTPKKALIIFFIENLQSISSLFNFYCPKARPDQVNHDELNFEGALRENQQKNPNGPP
jgi:hypothetical protein